MQQGKTIMSFAADTKFVELVDRVIKKTGSYSSKSEFLRDAARQRLIQLLGLEDSIREMEKPLSKLRKKVKYYKPLTKKAKDDVAMEYLKENPL